MKLCHIMVSVAAFALLGLWTADAQQEALPSNTSTVLTKALEAQIAALNSEDPDAVVSLFHPRAPGLKESRKGLVEMFRRYDLNYTLDQKHYIGVDGRYAYMRVIQTTRGGNMRPTRSEQLFVFCRAGKEWKFWTSAMLRKEVMPDKKAPR